MGKKASTRHRAGHGAVAPRAGQAAAVCAALVGEQGPALAGEDRQRGVEELATIAARQVAHSPVPATGGLKRGLDLAQGPVAGRWVGHGGGIAGTSGVEPLHPRRGHRAQQRAARLRLCGGKGRKDKAEGGQGPHRVVGRLGRLRATMVATSAVGFSPCLVPTMSATAALSASMDCPLPAAARGGDSDRPRSLECGSTCGECVARLAGTGGGACGSMRVTENRPARKASTTYGCGASGAGALRMPGYMG